MTEPVTFSMFLTVQRVEQIVDFQCIEKFMMNLYGTERSVKIDS